MALLMLEVPYVFCKSFPPKVCKAIRGQDANYLLVQESDNKAKCVKIERRFYVFTWDGSTSSSSIFSRLIETLTLRLTESAFRFTIYTYL